MSSTVDPTPAAVPQSSAPMASGIQLTLRAVVIGMLLGGFMSLSNLYVALKTGWSIGVSITASVLAFALVTLLLRLPFLRNPQIVAGLGGLVGAGAIGGALKVGLGTGTAIAAGVVVFVLFNLFIRLMVSNGSYGMMENNIAKSVASSAGYMTGGGTVAAIPALMMITGEAMDGWHMFFWITSIALLGVIMAIPMKQQMVNIEQLRFPTGIAAAETLQALHGEGAGGAEKARYLGMGGIAGAVVALFRDYFKWIPEKIQIPYITLSGQPLLKYTLSFEGSLIMVGAGAIMGFRAAWSMLLGAIINFGILAPILYQRGIIDAKLGYKNIVAWSVWFGSAMILTSGLLAFAYQWRTVLRAITSVADAFKGKKAADDDGEVPMLWFFIGILILSPIVIYLEHYIFGIKYWMGALSVFLGFFIAIVACRATGETDTTPTGALGKITQITFGILDPGNVTTNLMTANVTGGVGLHAADLLTDLKTGYILKADPKQQFWGQLFGVFAGSLFVVPAYRMLIPTADLLGTDQWPAPGAQTWKGVAELLAKGFFTLHWTAQWALFIGGILGILLVLAEKRWPKYRGLIPSATGLGLAFTTPAFNTISMFVGACITLYLEARKRDQAEKIIVPVSSGFIAGESLVGVGLAALVVFGLTN